MTKVLDAGNWPIAPSLAEAAAALADGKSMKGSGQAESTRVFRAMADETRRRTLSLLQRHELSVSELVEILGQPQSTVSRHLKVLRDAGLIGDRREGTSSLYAARPVGTDAAAGTGSGDGADAATGVLRWAARQDLEAELRDRLHGVLRRRQEMSQQFFDRAGRHWDKLREESFGPTFHLEALVALLPDEWVVADVGTGTGYLLPVVARHFSRVIGVDSVERMLQAARQRVGAGGLDNVELRWGDLTRLPMSEAEVDLAVAILVLHHVPVPEEALGELRRVVKPGGRVLVIEQASHRHEAFRERMQDHWWGFEPALLGKQLEAAGFRDVRTQELSSVVRAADAPTLFVITARCA